jgi:hypothetical protein
MIAAIPASWPNRAAPFYWMGRDLMEITLHIGAHRSGTTSFQYYMRHNAPALAAQSLGFWGPHRTRKSLFPGLFPGPAAAKGRNLRLRAEGRVQMNLAQARARGLKDLLVSDENMIGSARQCIRGRQLYPAIGERMARVRAAFGQIDRAVLVIRAQDAWWSSAIAYGVARGHPVPTALALAEIAASPRSWRDVITDLACALPDTKIEVLPFEQHVGAASALLEICAPVEAPKGPAGIWLNRAPQLTELRNVLRSRGEQTELPQDEGRWQPFDAEQSARLRENYADDLFWLTAGADGLATLTEDRLCERTGPSPSAQAHARGHHDDNRQGHLAQPG